MSTAEIKPSPDQEYAIRSIRQWAQGLGGEISLGGLAGSGKSFVSNIIINELKSIGRNVVTLCPTGKAADVLRRKGQDADTIHSAIYLFAGEFERDDGERHINWDDRDEMKDGGDIVLVDESSMVNAQMASDLRSFGKPIIWVGDHGQLPPIGGDPGIMRNPDLLLEKIHRQAEGSGIIEYAHAVREGSISGDYDNVTRAKYVSVGDSLNKFGHVDQIICGFNATRASVNKQFRLRSGHRGLLEVGDKIICRHNNRQQFIFNGQQFYVRNIMLEDDRSFRCSIESCDSEKRYPDISIVKGGFGNVKNDFDRSALGSNEILADYAYAITCHSSQGSSWKRVLVIRQECKAWDIRRWHYTASTRAEEELFVVG